MTVLMATKVAFSDALDFLRNVKDTWYCIVARIFEVASWRRLLKDSTKQVALYTDPLLPTICCIEFMKASVFAGFALKAGHNKLDGWYPVN